MAVLLGCKVKVVPGEEYETVVLECVIACLKLFALRIFAFTKIGPYVGPVSNDHP